MMSALERKSNGYLSFNTLYLAIYRLRELLFIEEAEKTVSGDNRVRVYFTITEAGREYLENLITEYKSFSDVINQILSWDEIADIS